MIYVLAGTFFAFICWIIFQADAGANNVFINFAHSIPYGDKLGHIGLYGLLALLMSGALRFKVLQVAGRSVLVGSAAVLLFALGEELTQGMFKTRTLDVKDAVADVVGVVGVSYLTLWLLARRAKRRKDLPA